MSSWLTPWYTPTTWRIFWHATETHRTKTFAGKDTHRRRDPLAQIESTLKALHNGDTIRGFGVTQDITERKQAGRGAARE